MPLMRLICGLSVLVTCSATDLHTSSLLQRSSLSRTSRGEVDEGSHSLVSASQFVSELVQKVVGHDVTLTTEQKQALDSIQSWIKDSLARWQTAFDADNEAIQAVAAAQDKCGTVTSEQLTTIVAAERDAADKQKEVHSLCRGKQKKLHIITVDKCDKYNSHRADADPPKCLKLNKLTTSMVSTGNAEQLHEMEKCLVKLNEWINPLHAKHMACKGAKKDENDQKLSCNKEQTSFEEKFCIFADELTSTCHTQIGCRSSTGETKEEVFAAMRVAEAARIADWKTAHKVQCLLDVLTAANAEKTDALEKCNAVVSTNHLIVDFPAGSSAVRCVDADSRPCNSTWSEAQYANESWYVDAPPQTCLIGCPAAKLSTPAPPPTEAPELWDWTLVMKMAKGSGRFHYASHYWSEEALFSPDSLEETVEDAKYGSFLSTPFKSIRFCVNSPRTSCVTHSFTKTYTSAKELFSGPEVSQESANQTELLSAYLAAFEVPAGMSSSEWCGMQKPGFNVKCMDGNEARIGFCANCANQPCQTSRFQDSDAAIGIGIMGQHTPPMGAGWTNGFATGTERQCEFDSAKSVSAWLWVRP